MLWAAWRSNESAEKVLKSDFGESQGMIVYEKTVNKSIIALRHSNESYFRQNYLKISIFEDFKYTSSPKTPNTRPQTKSGFYKMSVCLLFVLSTYQIASKPVNLL